MAAATPFSLPWRTMYLTSNVPSGRASVTFATPPSLFTPGDDREGTLTKSPTLKDGVFGDDGGGGSSGVDDEGSDELGGRVKVGDRDSGGGGGIACCVVC